MKKILYLMMATLTFTRCSSNDGESEDYEKVDFSFESKEIEAIYQEEKMIDILGIEPSRCNIYSSDEFILNVSNSNNKIKISPNYAGKSLVIAEYKGIRDTCHVRIKPTSSYAEEPVLELGTSRKVVREKMSQYQQAGTIGGYTGEDYYFNTKSKVRYQFDSDNKLVVIKQELTKSAYSIDRVKRGISQRYKSISNSSNVYWYSHPNVMTVRVEEQSSTVYIWFAKDASIMNQYYPW